jgi:hypothetical protein
MARRIPTGGEVPILVVVGTNTAVLACRVLGHRIRFSADGPVMRWSCDRGCGEGGEKTYETAAEARRYAAAFDRRDSDRVGNHRTLSTVPLWIVRRLRRGRT